MVLGKTERRRYKGDKTGVLINEAQAPQSTRAERVVKDEGRGLVIVIGIVRSRSTSTAMRTKDDTANGPIVDLFCAVVAGVHVWSRALSSRQPFCSPRLLLLHYTSPQSIEIDLDGLTKGLRGRLAGEHLGRSADRPIGPIRG